MPVIDTFSSNHFQLLLEVFDNYVGKMINIWFQLMCKFFRFENKIKNIGMGRSKAVNKKEELAKESEEMQVDTAKKSVKKLSHKQTRVQNKKVSWELLF